MKAYSCSGCGFVHKGDAPPQFCPVCKAPTSAFIEMEADASEAVQQKME